ncbi:MAG: hypothetical protein JW841_09825 [Deltaproteobacteria bacterium]|nr:hypothetical protein [Deltaproteobacteria bacterium]
METNWVNEVLKNAKSAVKSWPEWMHRPEYQVTHIQLTQAHNSPSEQNEISANNISSDDDLNLK